eukprot:1366513-Karenia_brevis.AAC.1
MGAVLCWDWGDVRPPELRDYARTLETVDDSGVGPDGIPYSAWHAAGQEGVVTLSGVSGQMMSGFGAGPDFNELDTVFLAKDQIQWHLGGVVCSGERTRPIGCKNSDDKTISSTLNFMLRRK